MSVRVEPHTASSKLSKRVKKQQSLAVSKLLSKMIHSKKKIDAEARETPEISNSLRFKKKKVRYRGVANRKKVRKRRESAARKCDEAMQRARELMEEFDFDHDGILGKVELGNLMNKMASWSGQDLREKDVDMVYTRANLSRAGAYDGDAIVGAISIWAGTLQDRQYMKEVWRNYDTEGGNDRKLNASELKNFLTHLSEESGGSPVTDDEVAKILKRVDRNGNGLVDEDELGLALCEWFAQMKDREAGCRCIIF